MVLLKTTFCCQPWGDYHIWLVCVLQPDHHGKQLNYCSLWNIFPWRQLLFTLMKQCCFILQSSWFMKYAAIVTIRLCFSQPVNRELYARLQVNFGTVKVIILLVKWSSERNMYTFIWLIVLANSCNFSYKSQCMWLNLIMKYVYLEVRKIITSFRIWMGMLWSLLLHVHEICSQFSLRWGIH